ncbi:hypothetical protein HY212_06175 [Candidatus Pacearchaeota archaeon]|nr:hypothetical protein [Candidatus Pacearchaeota archaeon]
MIFSTHVYGQTTGELGYRLTPNKIMKDTNGILQVYAVGDTGPTSVKKLIATSSDSSIIQILGIEQNENGFVTDVKIRAVGEGTAKIALAAPDFSSQELSLTVYKNSDVPAKLLLKTTPSAFISTGPTQGYTAVELTNNDGFPTNALDDTVVTLSSSDNNIVNVKTPQLVIKKGQYFAYGQFEAKQNGAAQISASSASMQTVSSAITVGTSSPQTIQVYVYPTTISSSIATNAYVVVQLHDSSGNPVQAKEDIPISVQITNSSGTTSINTSNQNQLISANSPLVINKGSYWGYVRVSVNAGLTGSWNVGISAKSYQVSAPALLNTVTAGALDIKSAKVDILPVLATGQKELVGIMHLQDSDGNPVLASQNLQIKIDSSDTNYLSVDDVKLSTGDGAAPVFGYVGLTIPSNQITLNVISDPTQTINPIFSKLTTTSTLQLVADSLIPKIRAHSDFPLAVYISQNGVLAQSVEDMNVLVSPDDFIQTKSTVFPKGESVMILNSNLLKEGTNSISVTAGGYVSNLSLVSLSSKPSSLLLDHPDKILSNVNNTFSVELLDSQQLPVNADNDIKLELVSNDPSILKVPESLVIKKGNYYSLFDAEAIKTGNAEISVLTNEIPLSKFDIGVTSLTPDVSISYADYVNPNFSFNASLTAQYHATPLSGLKVDWTVQGAKIQNMETMTDKDGKAIISLISDDPKQVSIDATVSGGVYGITTANKVIAVNAPLTPQNSQSVPTDTNMGFSIFGINPVFIIIPVAAAVGVIVLKKKNMLEGITEKIGLSEKFSEIKEKISGLREK